MAALLWSSQWPVGSPSRYFSRINASWMARQRWSSIYFCPRFFHEPRRFDLARCNFPVLVVLDARGLGLASERVLASAKPAEAATKHKSAAKTANKRVDFFRTETTGSIPRMLGKGPTAVWRRASFHVWMLDATQVFT